MKYTVLLFIRNWQKEKRYSPSVREIAEGCEISKSYAQETVEKLVELGWLEKAPNGTVKFWKPLRLTCLSMS